MSAVAATIGGTPVTTRLAMKMEDALQALAIRAACFIGELQVPFADELDGHDHAATHVIAYLGDGLPADHPFAALRDTLPSGHAGSPELWLLGSSPDSAAWAGETGLPYCIADFINSDGVPLADLYRRAFKPSRWLEKPHLMVATWVIAADSAEQARQFALPAQMMFAHLIRGELIAVPSVEKAIAWAAGQSLPERKRRVTLGTGAEVCVALDEVAALYGADELMLVNIMPDHEARCRSYQLVAKAFGLDGARLVESGQFTQN